MSCFRMLGRSTSIFRSIYNKKLMPDFLDKRFLPLSFNFIVPKRTYLGTERPVAMLLNKKDSMVMAVNQIRTDGFVLVTGHHLVGSIIIFPHSLISWHVTNARDVTEESLTLFKILYPKIDLLLFGYGSVKDYTPEVRETFTKFCKKQEIKFEALPTEHAAGLFNFLASEKRYVAALLIPPSTLEYKWSRKKYLDLEELEEVNVDLVDNKGFELLDNNSNIKTLK